jgi:flagellar biosynthesis protein FlhB
MSDKTEEASPKRVRDAQLEGNSGQSTFAAGQVGFLLAVLLLPSAFRSVPEALAPWFDQVGQRARHPHTPWTFDHVAVVATVLKLAVPAVAVAGIAGALVMFLQSGGVIATKKLGFKLSSLNPASGIKNLISLPKIVSALRGLGLLAVMIWLAYGLVRDHLGEFVRLIGVPRFALALATTHAHTLLRSCAGIGLVAALADVLVTRFHWKKGLRMSKDEVKREHKENDGNPEQKAARERAHHEMMNSATISAVKQAKVLVVNPTHIACALRYNAGEEGDPHDDNDERDEAPVLLAAGEGDQALQMIQAARAYGIPIVRNVQMARLLKNLTIGEEIPEALYEAVAEILHEAEQEQGT